MVFIQPWNSLRDEAGLEFAVSILSHISSAGIIGMCHHTKIKNCLLLHVCEGLGR